MKKFTTQPRLFASSPGYVGSKGRECRHWGYWGRLAESGPLTDIRFDTDMAHVISLFGKRGSGKSYTLGSMLECLCTKNLESSVAVNSRKAAVLLFDTLGIFQWMKILLKEDSRKEIVQEQYSIRKGWNIESEELDVSIWVPKGSVTAEELHEFNEFSINCSDFAAEDWGYLLGLDIYQDRMGQLLNDAYIKVTLEGWADSNRRYQPVVNYTIEDLINCVTNDEELVSAYQSETRRAILQQLMTYHRNPLFQDMGTSLTDLLKPGKMSVIVMNKMSDELRLIVVAAFMRQLIASRVRASEAEKHLHIRDDLDGKQELLLNELLKTSVPPTWVCIDEAQNILPSERKTPATAVLVKYVREGRNFGLSFVIATQQPTAIDPRILAQVDTLITHKLTVQSDLDYVRKNLKSNMPFEIKYGNAIYEFDQVVRSLDVGQALVSNTETERAFIMNVRPRISVHGGF